MGKFIRSIVDTQDWMNNIAIINTVVFSLLFAFLIYGILKMKKKDIEEYKNFPLEDD